jgi:hypothetical protein
MFASEFRDWYVALGEEAREVADQVTMETLFGPKPPEDMLILVSDLRTAIVNKTMERWVAQVKDRERGEGLPETLSWRWQRRPGTQGPHDTGLMVCNLCHTGRVVFTSYSADAKLRCMKCGAQCEDGQGRTTVQEYRAKFKTEREAGTE